MDQGETPEVSESQIPPERKDAEEWVRELIETGFQRLQSPPGLETRDFVITLRKAVVHFDHPEMSVSQAFSGGDWRGTTEVIVIDILEEKDDGKTKVYKPVGYRDYRIARLRDGSVAFGNRGSRLNELKTPMPYRKRSPAETFYIPFNEIDAPMHFEGIRVEEEYRERGFGRFLAAVGFEVLKQEGIQLVDFSATVFKPFRKALTELGADLTSSSSPRQPIETFNWRGMRDSIKPFIPSTNV